MAWYVQPTTTRRISRYVRDIRSSAIQKGERRQRSEDSSVDRLTQNPTHNIYQHVPVNVSFSDLVPLHFTPTGP